MFHSQESPELADTGILNAVANDPRIPTKESFRAMAPKDLVFRK